VNTSEFPRRIAGWRTGRECFANAFTVDNERAREQVSSGYDDASIFLIDIFITRRISRRKEMRLSHFEEYRRMDPVLKATV